MNGRRIVLTADRTLMTNYRGNFLFGFIACGPHKLIPEWVMDRVFCPTVEADPITGEARVAQCGLRRVEAALLRDGYDREDVFIVHPDYVERAIGPDTKVVGIHAMDPLGMAPVTTTLSPDYEPYNAAKFRELMERIIALKAKHGFKTVLGGAGAWQFSRPERREKFGVDYSIQGEVDGRAGEIFRSIEDGNAPEFQKYWTRTVDEVPLILGPTINSLIEAMRGCGRGCDFCDVNLRKKRDFPIERLRKEASVNFNYGFDALWMHSDEMLLYGCTDHKNFTPNRDAVLGLYEAMRDVGFSTVGTTHWTFSAVVSEPEMIGGISKINGLGPDKWLAVQPGLETVAPRLVRQHLAYKTKPFAPDEWAWVVEEGIKVCNQNYYFPAITLIVGFPDEEPDETRMTTEFVRGLKSARCLFAPLLYQDYYEKNSLTWRKMNEAQFELFWECWRHNLRVIDWTTQHVIRTFRNPAWKVVTFGLMKVGLKAIFRYLRGVSKRNFGKSPEQVLRP